MRDVIISPIIGYFNAFLSPEKKSSFWGIVMFCTIFGFIMSIDREEADLYRYLRSLDDAPSITEVVHSFFVTRQEVDLFAPLSISIFRCFTRSGHILMAFFGFVYGLLTAFFAGFWRGAKNNVSIALIFVFFFYLSIIYLPGVRNITADYAFLLGISMLYINNDKRGFIFILSSALIHFSFLMVIGVFLASYLLKDRSRICFIIFIASFLFNIIDVSAVFSSVASFLGEGYVHRSNIYSVNNLDYIETLKASFESTRWIIVHRDDVLLGGLLCYGITLLIERSRLSLTNKTVNILNFFFLLFAFRNLVVGVPDVGVRITRLCCAIAIFIVFLINNENNENRSIRNASIVVIISSSLSLVYTFRVILDYVDVWELFLTPVLSVPINILNY